MAQRKIFVLGSKGAGKTALITKNLNTSPSLAVNFENKKFDYGTTKIKMQVWDTSGASKLDVIIGSYINGNDADNFCIVIDPTSLAASIEKAKHYLNLIRVKRQTDNPIRIQFVVTKDDIIVQHADQKTNADMIRAALAAKINALTEWFKTECQSAGITNVTIFDDPIFCSATDPASCDAVYDNFIAAFTAEDDESDEDSAGADTVNTPSTPWSAKKLYGWAKNLLGIGLLATVGVILTSVFRSSLPDAIFTGMNAGFFGFIALCMVAALGTFIAAAVAKAKGDPGKNSDAKSHWFQIPFKVFAVIAVASLFGVAASAVYALPIISPALEIIKTAFSDINFPGLHAALPPELVATFAVVFVAAVTYLIIDAAFRFYNSRWNNHDPKIMPTVHPIAASIFNLNDRSSTRFAKLLPTAETDEEADTALNQEKGIYGSLPTSVIPSGAPTGGAQGTDGNTDTNGVPVETSFVA